LIVNDKPTTATSHTAANAPTVAKSGRSPILLDSMMAPVAVVEASLA
jgi:hypothetical protein